MANKLEIPATELKKELRDADTCTALGLGVGAMGVTAAVTIGAVCPLCYFIAPGLVALGVGKRWRTKRKQKIEASGNEKNS